MSMAAHPSRSEIVGGINSSEDALKSGPNQNCRVYNVQDNKYVCLPVISVHPRLSNPRPRLSFSHAQNTIHLTTEDDDFQVSLIVCACPH